MRRIVPLVLGLSLAAAPVAAQGNFIWIGGGPTFPTSDYGEYAKTGWMANLGFGLGLGSSGKLALLFEGLYGSNSHNDDLENGGGGGSNGKTNLYGGMLGLEYELGNLEKLHPYVFGGGGLLVHSYSPPDGATYDGDSDSKFTYQVGGGVVLPMKSVNLWTDVRYLARLEDYPTAVIAWLLGVSIPLGGK